MVAPLLMLVPVGLVLGIALFGDHAGRPVLEPTRANFAAVTAASVALGPVAVAVLGIFLWLVAVLVAVGCLTMAAVLRAPGTRRLRAH